MPLSSLPIRLVALAWSAALATTLAQHSFLHSTLLNSARTARAVEARADSDSLVNAYAGEMSIPEAERQMKEVSIDVVPLVHAFHAPLPYGPAPLANEMLIEQSNGLVLVDGGKTRGAGERIVALIRSISSKPLKAVIITHWHQDHVMGLGPILAAWPHAQVISSVATRDHIVNEDSYRGSPLAPGKTAERDSSRKRALTQYALDYGAKIHDSALSPEERRGWANVVGVLNLRIADDSGSWLVVPTTTFDREYRIDDPIAPVVAKAIGRAHTDGDIVVWLPKQRVVAAGDVVVNPIPYGATNVLEWAGALRALRAFEPRAIVPGHGDVERDLAYVDRMISALDVIAANARRLAAGPALDDSIVQARVDLARERREFAGGDPWLAYWFDQYFAPNVVVAYHELRKGKGS